MTEDQKIAAFETAMLVISSMAGDLGAAPEDMKAAAEGVIDAAIAAAKKLDSADA